MCGDGLAQDGVVASKGGRHRLLVRLPEASAARKVGEQKCDSADRQRQCICGGLFRGRYGDRALGEDETIGCQLRTGGFEERFALGSRNL
jgi:hypothetical protein